MAGLFALEMGLGALGIAPKGKGWRVVTGPRAERLRTAERRWFCGSNDRAELVAVDARRALAKLPPPITVEEARETISATARALGVLMVTEESIRRHAERVLSQVEAAFASLSSAGELQQINRSYRQYRIAATAAGEKPIGYATFISNYKRGLVRAAAQHSRINLLENGSDIEK